MFCGKKQMFKEADIRRVYKRDEYDGVIIDLLPQLTSMNKNSTVLLLVSTDEDDQHDISTFLHKYFPDKFSIKIYDGTFTIDENYNIIISSMNYVAYSNYHLSMFDAIGLYTSEDDKLTEQEYIELGIWLQPKITPATTVYMDNSTEIFFSQFDHVKIPLNKPIVEKIFIYPDKEYDFLVPKFEKWKLSSSKIANFVRDLDASKIYSREEFRKLRKTHKITDCGQLTYSNKNGTKGYGMIIDRFKECGSEYFRLFPELETLHQKSFK